MREGQGKCKFANGDLYDGTWLDNKRTGSGTCAFDTGDKYTGAEQALILDSHAWRMSKGVQPVTTNAHDLTSGCSGVARHLCAMADWCACR